MSRTALLAGATGLVGGHCLDLLLDLPGYARVVTVGRRRTEREHPNLEERIVDFDQLEGLPRADDLFCCLGTTIAAAGSEAAFRRVDHDYVVAFARAGLAAGARRLFLVTALGADPDSRIFYNRVKGQVERSVAELGFDSVHILRPSLLLGARDESRPTEAVGQWLGRLLAPLMVGPLRRYRPLPAREVATALVAACDSSVAGVSIHYSSLAVR